jgi:ER lumen protein retaining receptor
MRWTKRLLGMVMAWVQQQPPKVKDFLAVVTGMATLVFILFIVHNHDNFFVAVETAHTNDIRVLIYKLTKENTCSDAIRSGRGATSFLVPRKVMVR